MASPNRSRVPFWLRDDQEYDMDEVVGEGRFARVLKAKEKVTGKVLAVKVFKKGEPIELEVSARWIAKHEENMLECVRGGPYIIAAGSARNLKNGQKLVEIPMDFYQDSLVRLMNRTRNTRGLSDKDGCIKVPSYYNTVLEQMLQALEYLHSSDISIIHRDIRPENILCNDDQFFVLADFGHARHGGTNCTECNGAYEYMPPEMYVCDRQTFAADIWSLGVLGLDMLNMVPVVPEEDRTLQMMVNRKWLNLLAALARHCDKPELEKMVQLRPRERSTASGMLRFLRNSPSTQIHDYTANVFLLYLMFRELEQFKGADPRMVRAIAYGFQESTAQARAVSSMGSTLVGAGSSSPLEGRSSTESEGVYSASTPLPEEIHQVLAASGLVASPCLSEIHSMTRESGVVPDVQELSRRIDSALRATAEEVVTRNRVNRPKELVTDRSELLRPPTTLTPGILQALIKQDTAGPRRPPTTRSARRARAGTLNPASRPVTGPATSEGLSHPTPGPLSTAQTPRSADQSEPGPKPSTIESPRPAGPSSSTARPLPVESQRNTEQVTSETSSTLEGKQKKKERSSSAKPTRKGQKESGGCSSSIAPRPGAIDSGAGPSGHSQKTMAEVRIKGPTKPPQKKSRRVGGLLSSVSRGELEAASSVEERQAPVRTGMFEALEAVRASEAALEEQRKKTQARTPQATSQERQGPLQMGQASPSKAAKKEQQKSNPKKERLTANPKKQEQSSSSKKGPSAPPVAGEKEREPDTSKEAKAAQAVRSTQAAMSTQSARSSQSASSGNLPPLTPPKSVNRSGASPLHPPSTSAALRPTSSTLRFTSSDSVKNKAPESNQSSGSLQSVSSPGLNADAPFWFPRSETWPPKQGNSAQATKSQASANLPPPPARSIESQQSGLSEFSSKASTPRLLEVGGEHEAKHDNDDGGWQQPRRKGRRSQSRSTSDAQAQDQSQGRRPK